MNEIFTIQRWSWKIFSKLLHKEACIRRLNAASLPAVTGFDMGCVAILFTFMLRIECPDFKMMIDSVFLSAQSLSKLLSSSIGF